MFELSQLSSWVSSEVGLKSRMVWSDLFEGLLPLEVSVEAPDEMWVSDTVSEMTPSTLTKMIQHPVDFILVNLDFNVLFDFNSVGEHIQTVSIFLLNAICQG